jgi:hypothetical protein
VVHAKKADDKKQIESSHAANYQKSLKLIQML